MQGIKRKLVYVSLFETIAIGCTTIALMLFADSEMGHAGILAVASSLIAVVWNLTYNTAFEAWESRQVKRGRDVWRRIQHAFGFEVGLVIIFVPLFAWWLDVSLWTAFLLDLGLIIFFLIYTYIFNLMFDHIFGLPKSAL